MQWSARRVMKCEDVCDHKEAPYGVSALRPQMEGLVYWLV